MNLACRRGNQVQRGEQGGRRGRAGWADPRGSAAWLHRCGLGRAQPLKARSLSTASGCRGSRSPADAQPDPAAEAPQLQGQATPGGARGWRAGISGSFQKVWTRVGDRKPAFHVEPALLQTRAHRSAWAGSGCLTQRSPS